MMGRRGPPGRDTPHSAQPVRSREGPAPWGVKCWLSGLWASLPPRHRCCEADVQHLASAVLCLHVHAYVLDGRVGASQTLTGLRGAEGEEPSPSTEEETEAQGGDRVRGHTVTSAQPAPASVLSLLPIVILCVHALSGCTSELRNRTSWRERGGGVERGRDSGGGTSCALWFISVHALPMAVKWTAVWSCTSPLLACAIPER